MRAVLALVLLLLAAPALAAAESDPVPRVDAIAAVEVAATDDTPEPPAPYLDKVEVERRAAGEAPGAALQEMPQRGSFWWLVGVIVVAGVILALLLD